MELLKDVDKLKSNSLPRKLAGKGLSSCTVLCRAVQRPPSAPGAGSLPLRQDLTVRLALARAPLALARPAEMQWADPWGPLAAP